MYFIARNNAMYNYIAHTHSKRRYLATFGLTCALYFVGAHLLYYPLLVHTLLLKNERAALQKKDEHITQWNKDDSQLLNDITLSQQHVARQALEKNAQSHYRHKRILFILDTITQLGMVLNAYGLSKEKDKMWYAKEMAHFDVAGSQQQILAFLEKIKGASMMIAISCTTITRMTADMFRMSFDAGLVIIKCKKSPSTLNS